MTALDRALEKMHREVGGVLNRLASAAEEVAIIAAPQIFALVQQEFATGRDPYGSPWAPLRPSTLRKHGPPPLTDRGLMRGTTSVRPIGKGRPGLVIRYPFPGVYHQAGTRRMAARHVLPYRGIPRMWADILRRASVQAVREANR